MERSGYVAKFEDGVALIWMLIANFGTFMAKLWLMLKIFNI